jgi:large subunit ribosomal protein L34e
MRKQLRSSMIKKMQVVTPGGRTVVHYKYSKPDYPRCGSCGVKLSVRRLSTVEAGAFSKSSRRPERRFPGFCARCSREALKLKVRGGELEMLVKGM